MGVRKGLYIVFEGIGGSGKSLQSVKLKKYLKHKFPKREVIRTFEPGGGEIAKDIRFLVQTKDFKEEMEPLCEAYLYGASRAQTLNTIVKPVLDNGGVVVSDRSFITSLAYQGIGGEIGMETVIEVNKNALEIAFPDIVIFFEIDPATSYARTTNRHEDKFDRKSIEFFERLAAGYREAGKHELIKDVWHAIDINGDDENKVFEKVLKELEPSFVGY